MRRIKNYKEPDRFASVKSAEDAAASVRSVDNMHQGSASDRTRKNLSSDPRWIEAEACGAHFELCMLSRVLPVVCISGLGQSPHKGVAADDEGQ